PFSLQLQWILSLYLGNVIAKALPTYKSPEEVANHTLQGGIVIVGRPDGHFDETELPSEDPSELRLGLSMPGVQNPPASSRFPNSTAAGA
ncbi:hypothetical protein C0992_007046, partial [Termitomyces sp. T32_za158]